MSHRSDQHAQGTHSRPYMKFWTNMGLSLVVMYVVMFSMIDGWGDFRNNLNMFYMAVTMWAPMGIFMLLTMRGMYPDRTVNLLLYLLFVAARLSSRVER